MNDLFLMLGIESWKPVLSSLLLPPVPFLFLTLVGARMISWRRVWGWTFVLSATLGVWLSACYGVGEWLQSAVLSPPPPLASTRITTLGRDMVSRQSVAIVVLGSGREALAPEYGVASLVPTSSERLRYGIWLGRQTGAPVMFSGGLGHAAQPGAAEAEVAAQIAARDFGRPLRWAETRSRDTRENARYAVALLHEEPKVGRLVLVTSGWHMPRALRAFREASARAGAGWELIPAPMGLASRVERPSLRWVPSAEGVFLVRAVVSEKMGWWLGA
ncbi:MAG: YdcF family protein [Pseudomonadota bacterium]